jgi:hypothetical protein
VASFKAGRTDIMIAQSLYFKRSFVLRRVTPRFSITTIDPAKDVQFRCEVRPAYGEDNLLDTSSSPVISSDWITDDLLPKNDYCQFQFDGVTVLTPGFYYLCFVPNVQLRFPIEMSMYSGGNFLGNLIEIQYGTGVYRNSDSLTIKVDGEWQSGSSVAISIVKAEIHTSTIIQDGS